MTDNAAVVEAPIRPSSLVLRPPARNLEFYSWYFNRLSGLALIFLALGHFALMHVVHSILDVDYNFAARRWANVGWRAYDWLLLVLTLLHGFNGLRVMAGEYLHAPGVRRVAQLAVWLVTIGFLALGTYVVIAFQAPPGL
jgi:succinate dehydrogenase / fumarate reductase membrane anchor subunit